MMNPIPPLDNYIIIILRKEGRLYRSQPRKRVTLD